MILFLDFDSTLFNTELFKREMGIVNVSCVENPEFCIKELSRVSGVEKFLFSDTVDFLKNNTRHRLILITFGDVAYQRAKVSKSGILHLFEETIFTGTEMKGDVIAQKFSAEPEKMIFLDDDVAQLQNMKAQCPYVEGVRIRRENIIHNSDIVQNEFPEVSHLEEFAKLLATF